MNTYVSLSSLAMDLKRAALGYYRGSNTMADRFLDEALDRKSEIDPKKVKPYINNLLLKMENLSKEIDKDKKAEDALLYSILFQNASIAISSKF